MRHTSNIWPYPQWIAHRGAGLAAPENTLAAFRLGATRGFRMVEYDVKLSADDVPILLHDERLERCSNGSGPAADFRYADLARLDFGGGIHRAMRVNPLQRYMESPRIRVQMASIAI